MQMKGDTLLQTSEKPQRQQILCQGPRLPLTLGTSSVAKSIWSHAFSLLCIHALNFFYIYSLSEYYHLGNVSALHRASTAASSLITLLFAFDLTSTKERIMFQLFQDLIGQIRIGVAYFKPSARHRAIPSNYPLLQFSWAHCFYYDLHLRDSLSTHFRETALMPPINVFLPLVIRVLFFPLLDYFFHSSDEHLVFLCFIWLVFQEHHRELIFWSSHFYLHFSFIHSSFHRIMQLHL